VKAKRSARDDEYALRLYINPRVGDVALSTFTLDHAEHVMRSLPAGLSAKSRRNVGQTLHRLLAMAVYPLRLIPANPLPKGFLPKPGPQKAKGYLYPDEDRKLLGCADVPLARRLFYGFLHREGPRLSEAARLDVADADLVRGTVNLDKNKTDDPRAWALSPGVAAALAASLALRDNPGPEAPLFVDELGARITDGKHKHSGGNAARFRDDLQAAGVDRAELFAKTTAERMRIRAHDTRATFVTIALANGKTETWVADRTGHKSSVMINRYRRAARMAAEIGLGDLAPLVVAIPELAPAVKAPPPRPRRGGSQGSGQGNGAQARVSVRRGSP
jgi:integrase